MTTCTVFITTMKESRGKPNALIDRIRAAKTVAPASPVLRIIMIAATVLFIAIVSAGLIKLSQHNRQAEFGDKLFATYFQPQNDPAFSHFSGNAYPELLRSQHVSDANLIYFAIQRMQGQDFKMAEKVLSDVISHNSPEFSAAAHWYHGLTLIKTGRIREAGDEFGKLCKAGGEYASHSCNILADLSKK